MAKKSSAVQVGVGTIIGAGILTYLGCRLHDDWHVQQGEPDRCVLPAIQAALEAAIGKLLGPIPLPVEAGIDYVLESADLYKLYGGVHCLDAPYGRYAGECEWWGA